MAQYAWEAAGRKKRNVKATGTVVFHPNSHVSSSFDDSKELSAETAEVLRSKLGFSEFLPAQAQTFKGISNGRDVILHSRTGSGKTLAYTLPVLERFLASRAALSEEERTMHNNVPAAPFLIVFVFGNELAVQTKSVMQSVYGDRVNVAVAGFDEITTETPVDVLVGTLGAVDKLVRGTGKKAAADAAASSDDDAASSSNSDDDGDSEDDESDDEESDVADEEEEEEQQPSRKTGKAGRGGKASSRMQGRRRKGHRSEQPLSAGIVSLARVRSIVIDEVDVTMGPKFSSIGRRMKNLLKIIRKSNGSLTAGLTNDYRMHHYVLCGATIPNWVIKAGFLGVKKYYYRLVSAGDAKLPQTLDCFTCMCPKRERIATSASLVTQAGLGRTIVFTTSPRVALLETSIKDAIAQAVAAQDKGAKAKKQKQSSKRSDAPVLRVLSSEKDEMERIACIEDFNSGAANVLLCTDSAARGLDFVAVDTVLMESMPDYTGSTDMFVHRAGRTARVANAGRCIWLADPVKDRKQISQLESVLHVSFKEFPRAGLAAASIGTSGAAPAKATLQLRVAKQLATKGGAAPPTPREVLGKLVEAPKILEVRDGSKPDRIVFDVSADNREPVRQALWKYDVTIL